MWTESSCKDFQDKLQDKPLRSYKIVKDRRNYSAIEPISKRKQQQPQNRPRLYAFIPNYPLIGQVTVQKCICIRWRLVNRA